MTNEWQPIETFPTGDDPVLAFCPEVQKTYLVYRFGGEYRYRIYASGGRWLYETPSHWQPLPAPPTVTEEVANASSAESIFQSQQH